jgi:heme/copper-type cytochrome/quinol oxidase subunit 2
MIGTMTAVYVIALVSAVVGVVVMFVLFVWAARKDGEEDRALQERLGIRRRTRLGR